MSRLVAKYDLHDSAQLYFDGLHLVYNTLGYQRIDGKRWGVTVVCKAYLPDLYTEYYDIEEYGRPVVYCTTVNGKSINVTKEEEKEIGRDTVKKEFVSEFIRFQFTTIKSAVEFQETLIHVLEILREEFQ